MTKFWAIALNGLSGLAGAAVIFAHDPTLYKLSLIVVLASPILCILLLYLQPRSFTVFGGKSDPRANLTWLLCWPALCIPISWQYANDPTHLVTPFQLSSWVIAVMVLLLVLVMPRVWHNPTHWAILIFLVVIGLAYGAGVVNAADTLLDASPAEPFSSSIVSKKMRHHRKGAETYTLVVAPWGSVKKPADVDVPRAAYTPAQIGDPICFGLHPGFLQAPWYTVISCSPAP